MNKVILLGNISKDIEVGASANSTYARFAIAHNKKIVANGKEIINTCFIDCVAWGKTAENIAHFFRKGSKILVEAELAQNVWTDNNGNQKSKHQLTIQRFDFVESNQSAQSGAKPANRQAKPKENKIPAKEFFSGQNASISIDDGDMPF